MLGRYDYASIQENGYQILVGLSQKVGYLGRVFITNDVLSDTQPQI